MEGKKYPRKLMQRVLENLESRQAVVIYGSRQVGKTTLLKTLLESHLPKNSFYFDLEMPDLLELCNRGPGQAYEYLVRKGADKNSRIFLLLDEVQYLEDPAKFIKLAVDHFSGIKLIVTGSSALVMRKRFSQSLAGRTSDFELYPLSFEEFLSFKGKRYSLGAENLREMNLELAELAQEYVRFGGYPEVVLAQEEGRKYALLSQIINTYVRKDVRDAADIKDIAGFNKLLSVIASQSANLLNVLELSSTIGIGRATVSSYLQILEDTFVIRLVRPFSENKRSEISKNPKVFMLDTGMMHVLWLREFPKMLHGSSFETFVFLELCKAGFEPNFWRTTAGQEVDFVFPAHGQLQAVEAKKSFGSAPKAGLGSFSRKYPARTHLVGLEGEKKNGKYAWELVKELEK